MGRSCCVPGCKSNYGVTDTSAFKFPKDNITREKWIRCIHRDNFTVTDNTLVCIKHFEDKFIIREDVFPVANGESITVPRKKPKLRDDAYPSIFFNQPVYHSAKVPKDRKESTTRAERLTRREEESFKKWCDEDIISSFENFKSTVVSRDIKPFILLMNEDYVLFIKVKDQNSNDIPSLTVSFKIFSDFNVKVFYKDMCVPAENFKWILETESQNDFKCNRWTKFDNLISHLQSYGDESFEINDRIKLLINFVKEVLEFSDFDTENIMKIKFALEQLHLSLVKKKTYSPEMLIWAARICYSFPGAYRLVRETNVLNLPHHVYLKQFLGKIGPISAGIESTHKSFLAEKSKLLRSEDKIVSIMLDEIYLNNKITYKGGKILGMAENVIDVDAATTMQVFMSSSLRSHNKDVIGLFPVKNLQADVLYDLTTQVLKVMNELGFHVVCLVSDNNSINRKLFHLLCGGKIKSSIPNPADPSRPLFLLFDTVHILKCIRNNWLNKYNQTFTIPNVEQVFAAVDNMTRANENESICCQYTTFDAKFSDLRDLFNSEKNMLLKLAPCLTRKSLYPTSIERQNVSLAANVFDYRNVVAFEMLKNQGDVSEGTVPFLKLFAKWWIISNVKHPMKGTYTKNADATPITGNNDSKLVFLENLRSYLDIWHLSENNKGKLSNDTYIAITQTLRSMVELCKYVFNTYGWAYILTGKIQTDNLEGRFGAYRRLSGCSYNVSAEQVLESERKLKVLSVLKLKSAQFGELQINDFASKVQKGVKEAIADNLEYLEPAIYEISQVLVSPETQKILVCIASYTCKKVVEKLNKHRSCDECRLMLQSNEEMQLVCQKEIFTYFTELNRGGLKCPSPFVITLCTNVYKLFQTLINDTYEHEICKIRKSPDSSNWKSSTLKDILSIYSVSDVFNLDKTGLFYHALPDKTLTFKKGKLYFCET